MTIREQISLRELTTFKAGGVVPFVIECESETDVREAVIFAQQHELPWYVLGEGSNMVPEESGYNGVILRMKDTTLFFKEEKEHGVHVLSGAGVIFDSLVQEAGKRMLWGLENLAGIPGTVGAAPVQNIGAYGAEIADTFLYAEVFDTRTQKTYRMDKEACRFSYRESIFKTAPHLIILNVAFALRTDGVPSLSYTDIALEQEKGTSLTTPTEIAETVRLIRSRKFPDWQVEGTAGSFFKNPVITLEAYEALVQKYGAIPEYSAEGGIKIPLAFILDKVLGLRGYKTNGARLFERQPLVLVLEKGAPASDIQLLADDVAQKVYDATGITIEREARSFV